MKESTLTLNPSIGEIDAVALPLAISDDINASGERAARGISNNPTPLPLKKLPLFNSIPPLTKSDPLN
jgi:hypothetical protein